MYNNYGYNNNTNTVYGVKAYSSGGRLVSVARATSYREALEKKDEMSRNYPNANVCIVNL